MEEEPPPIFNRKTWAGKVIGKCLQSESFKIDLFRFIDVFPYLNGPE
jgi:RHH-type proline utilization regulon transcriptional repressor/proline dehydrogenase/delta 1-pyrroline-5-carboxylate dehydrogenase